MNDERFALLVKQVKEASDIVAVVGSYLQLKQAGPTFKGLCPFHNDSRPSFDVDPRRQRYRCWSCGKFGDVIQFVVDYDKISFIEAFEALARRVDAPDPEGRLVWETLLRDASEAALRPLLPAYADPSARQWPWLRELCPVRTPALIALQEDADPKVAAGARKLFAYVQLNCKSQGRRG